jgi:catechol 2,3-dioxygenase-like lactoylglutathione lyase family enzyme
VRVLLRGLAGRAASPYIATLTAGRLSPAGCGLLHERLWKPAGRLHLLWRPVVDTLWAWCAGWPLTTYPRIRQTVLDTTDARALAEFYRELFGLSYRAGDEPPGDGSPDPRGRDWLVLVGSSGGGLAFQQVDSLPPATWPSGPVPQQIHLDTSVPSAEELDIQHERALALGARLLRDRSSDPEEPLRVYADPSGHPFCIFVAP